MAQRRHHYEAAFESYLRTKRIPYVAVDEARRALLPEGADLRLTTGERLKSFDFVLYGHGGNLLTEVKGRRLGVGRGGARAPRMECWVTREDVESLSAWEGLFGETFEAAFVFVYWCEILPPDALFDEMIEHRGRWYALRAIRVRDFRSSMKARSERWGTFDLRAADFDRLSRPLAGREWPVFDPPPMPLMETLAGALC
jgi:hypothetical protein